MNLFLWLPRTILASVKDDLVSAVKSRVEVEGDVAGFRLSTKQVDEEPAMSDSRWTTDNVSVL